LPEIKKILKKKANKKAKESFEKFIPLAGKIYGVRIPVLNDIARKIKEPNFDLIEKLWKEGSLEEKLLAGKILGIIGKKDPEKTMRLIKKMSKGVSDWAVCDTLGTQGVRQIAGNCQKEIFNLAKKYIPSKNLWQRRFGIVLLIELNRRGLDKKEAWKLAERIKDDKRPYIKKALEWLNNELKKH